MSKANPEGANSMQFYVRIPDEQICDCLKVSGAKGVYAILKTEDKHTDLSCSCVVGHANP